MEKRALTRNHTRISVACSPLTASSQTAVSNGTMLNCSCGGVCIELNQRIEKGCILMIKTAGWCGQQVQASPPEGFRMLSLAEVKWIKPLDEENINNYAIGLMYLPN